MRQLLAVCQHPHIEHGYTAYNKATENHQNFSDEFLTPPVHSNQENGWYNQYFSCKEDQ